MARLSTALACLAVLLNSAEAATPQNFTYLECALAQYASAFAASKVPASAAQEISDALNVQYLCENVTAADVAAAVSPHLAGLRAAADKHAAARAAATHVAAGAVASFYVSTTGSDANAGTLAAPFATLQRAAAAVRTVSPRKPGDVTVFLRAGTYYLGATGALVLSEADSNATWAAYPADAPAPVVLSGALLLPGLQWANYSGGTAPGILVAPVSIPDPRAERWAAAHPTSDGAAARAGPPPRVASLFIGGVRQVRARYPNGNPQDGSGICFSATQRPGEGCAAWSSCAQMSMGRQPAPAGVRVDGIGPNRGDSPTQGCPQCGSCGAFGYTIYPPPPDHPVYNEPLPGVGWENTSVFSFWGSPFDRPSGVLVDGSGRCDAHWQHANYANPSGAVVHMFHSGLWGGWMYAVDNITRVNSSEAAGGAGRLDNAAAALPLPAAIPQDSILWLQADTLPAGGDGQPLAAWPDASPAHHSASQGTAALQPTYHAAGWPGGLPSVRFSGKEYLNNDDLRLPTVSTMVAVVRDTGSTTGYCSGVFFSKGGENSICTKVAAEPGGYSDDDVQPTGASITATAIDYSGSPALPGHRNLAGRPVILSTVYGASSTRAFVDNCFELQDAAHGAEGTGYYIGSRNAEMGRYLVGDVAEVLVYGRALNATELAAINAYLAAKWSVPLPKKCAAAPPMSTDLAIAFGYGGYQEARGSGINPGQHFYLENLLEELDVPGEWFYDAAAGQLYLLPNMTLPQLAAAAVAVPVLDALVVVNGSQGGAGAYAVGLSFTGLTFTQSRVTFLEQYEVPSGGDWSVHRGGALFVQDAEAISIAGCTFDQVGGNGVILSNHVAGATVSDSEFVRGGDSAVILLGATDGIDGSAPTYPNGNTIARNHMHEIGVYGKQTSCVGLQLAANTSILDNVCYNGPRAGINYNDGFGGGNLFQGNVVFNAVRETGDHGPLNSWDRQPYWTYSHVDDGFNDPQGRSFIRAWDLNSKNLMLNGYNGVWTFDHDDCSQFVEDFSNFMVFGGCKNYVGDTKKCNGNAILYPGISGRSAGNRRCQTDDNGVFANQYHIGNTCTSADGAFYSFSGCIVNGTSNNLNTTVYVTGNNTLLADVNATFVQNCQTSLTFAQWQAAGQDAGSTTATTPDVAALIAIGAQKLA